MPASKISRLENIKDEVADLHPLLAKLLPKLPRVKDVEYTQGTGEMGADFVFSQQHDTFDYPEYVGVVAKVGALQQNFTEVERQIDECAVPRTFRNGKERIRLDEVWVVFTGHATKGAQEKIHEKYPTRKVVFVDGARLEKLIDQHLPEYWNVVPLETGEYLATLRAKNEQLDKSVSLVQVGEKSFYIEQDIFTFPRYEYRLKLKRLQKHSRRVNIFDVIDQEKMILIEGGMGAGKSKLVRRLITTLKQMFISRKCCSPFLQAIKNLRTNSAGI